MTFSHDGLRDSLTHLAAPPYFYENLRRDLATAERNKSRLTLIRFQIFPSNQSSDEESLYEVAILSFAELLKANCRAEDLCARLGRFEFTLILRAGRDVALSLTQRILEQWQSEEFTCKSSCIAATLGESSLEILNRLDNEELRGITSSY
ncbi:COG2199 c-di-GMP synthetase (diguanylate cyclase, GGDEF domain) [Candidatus Nanopelagicaceae bacterium]